MKYSDWQLSYEAREIKKFEKEGEDLEKKKLEAMLDYVRAQFVVHKHYENQPMVLQWRAEMDKFIDFNNHVSEERKALEIVKAKELIKSTRKRKPQK